MCRNTSATNVNSRNLPKMSNVDSEIIQIEPEPSEAEQNAREERKTTGRMVAIGVALFVIFLAIYHAWIRKTAVLAGILVPALIMLLYTGWVVFLSKRDKRRRQLRLKQAEEQALKEIRSREDSSSIRKNKVINSTHTHTRPHRRKQENGFCSDMPKKSRKRKHKVRRKIFKTKAQIKEYLLSPPDTTHLCRTCSAP